MDLLKRSERLFDILEAVAFNFFVGIPSAPCSGFIVSPENGLGQGFDYLYTGIPQESWMSQKFYIECISNTSGSLSGHRVVEVTEKLVVEYISFSTSFVTRAELGAIVKQGYRISFL